MISAEAVGLLSLSVTLIVHLAGTVWWAASLTKRVDHMERWASSQAQTGERLARLESALSALSASIDRIERMLSARRAL